MCLHECWRDGKICLYQKYGPNNIAELMWKDSTIAIKPSSCKNREYYLFYDKHKLFCHLFNMNLIVAPECLLIWKTKTDRYRQSIYAWKVLALSNSKMVFFWTSGATVKKSALVNCTKKIMKILLFDSNLFCYTLPSLKNNNIFGIRVKFPFRKCILFLYCGVQKMK